MFFFIKTMIYFNELKYYYINLDLLLRFVPKELILYIIDCLYNIFKNKLKCYECYLNQSP